MMSKDFFSFLKRNTMTLLINEGTLRSQVATDMDYKVRPKLIHHAEASVDRRLEADIFLSEVISKGSSARAKNHQTSLFNEMKRIQDAIEAEKKRQIKIQMETIERRKRRADMREELRIASIQNFIMTQAVQTAIRMEYKPEFTVLDICDMVAVNEMIAT